MCLVHTGQHYDWAMSKVFFDELGAPMPPRAAEIAVEASYPVATVYHILGAPRSTIHHRRAKGGERCQSALRPTSPTSSCWRRSAWCSRTHRLRLGYRKVRARLRGEQGIATGGKGCCASCAGPPVTPPAPGPTVTGRR